MNSQQKDESVISSKFTKFKSDFLTSKVQQHQKSGQIIKSKVRKPKSQLNIAYYHYTTEGKLLFNEQKTQQLFKNEQKNRDQPIITCDGENMCQMKYQMLSKIRPTNPQQFKQSYELVTQRMSMFSHSNNLQLDPRDERVKIPFQSNCYAQLQQSSFELSFNSFKDEIRDWLVDVIEINTSIAFNHIKRQNLNDKQAKNFASKNILLSLKELFQKYPKIPLQKRFQLMTFINAQSDKIFSNVIQKYPQTSSRGASKRIKSRIPKIDNRQSDQYDFLFSNDIKITYRDDGDYSEDIMRIVNKLIAFPADIFHHNDQKQESNYQVFTEIMEFIFEGVSQQSVITIAEEIAGIVQKKSRNKELQESLKQALGGIFNLAERQSERDQKKYSVLNKGSDKSYLIGQKIPSGTKMFTDEQLQGSNFKVYDSSILRLLTKWAEQLRSKLSNAGDSIFKRIYKFKNNKGKLINLEIDDRTKLYQEAQKQEKLIEQYLAYLKQQNSFLQTLFAQEMNYGKYSKNDTKVGIFASKINEIGSQYIFKYINKLIHALLSIPLRVGAELDDKVQKRIVESVDLITFKIGDLMRCKCACSQIQFIKILSVLDQIHLKNPQILRIVRIKNRMEQKDNDLLINLFFMNKVECEMQLSIIGNHNKAQKNYSNFNHFIYEIIRAQLGPISEMASIVSQYDPLVNIYCKKQGYGPELITKSLNDTQKKQMYERFQERIKFKKKMKLATNIELPFVCCTCQKLAIVHNPKFFYRDFSTLKRQCNNCRFLSMIVDQSIQGYKYTINLSFSEPEIRSFLLKHIIYWDSNVFIQKLENQTEDQCNISDLPECAFSVKANIKTPILQLYTYAFQNLDNNLVFVNVNQDGKSKLLAKIMLYCQKQRRIDNFKKQFKKIYIFNFKDCKQIRKGGILHLECTKQDCCKKTVRIGPVLSSNQIVQLANKKIIQCYMENQKSILYLNNVPRAFLKLQQVLSKFQNSTKGHRLIKAVQIIKAYSSQLDSINIISKFSNLIQLNINDNPLITSLHGIQCCLDLKNLDCKKCDITNLNELTKLYKLQYINVSHNPRLHCLQGLVGHSQLTDVFLGYTLIQCLKPLSKCFKLQTLDIQNCCRIKTLNPLSSQRLSDINIVNCSGLETFDLPLEGSQSIKNILIYSKQEEEAMGLDLVKKTLSFLNLNEEKKDGKVNVNQMMEGINQILKIRKTGSKILF